MWASPASFPGRCLLALPVLWASWKPRSHVSAAEPQPLRSAVLRSSSAHPELTLAAWTLQGTLSFASRAWVDALGFARCIIVCSFFSEMWKMLLQNNQSTVLLCIYIWHAVSFTKCWIHFKTIRALKCKPSSHAARRRPKRNSCLCPEVIKQSNKIYCQLKMLLTPHFHCQTLQIIFNLFSFTYVCKSLKEILKELYSL